MGFAMFSHNLLLESRMNRMKLDVTCTQVLVPVLVVLAIALFFTSKCDFRNRDQDHSERILLKPAVTLHDPSKEGTLPAHGDLALYQHRPAAGLDPSMLASRTGIFAMARTYITEQPLMERGMRCANRGESGMYIVWEVRSGRPHICYCLSGVEHCSDPLLSSGDGRLNCIGGLDKDGDCKACTIPGYLC